MMLGNLNIVKKETSELASKQLSKDLSAYLMKAKEQGENVLFLSSGGSALAALEFIPNDIFGEYLTVGILDERYDKTNINNNFTQLTKTEFYKKAKEAGCSFIDTMVKEGQSQEELSLYFDAKLKEWREKNLEGKMIATVGVGTDGHTSGIMPFPEDVKKFKELFESKWWVVAYDAVGKNPFSERVTTTITFLKRLNRVFILMTGEEKADAFLQIQKNGQVAEIPARALKNMSGNVYVDEMVLK